MKKLINKRLIVNSLILLLIFSLVGCGDDQIETTDKNDSSNITTIGDETTDLETTTNDITTEEQSREEQTSENSNEDKTSADSDAETTANSGGEDESVTTTKQEETTTKKQEQTTTKKTEQTTTKKPEQTTTKKPEQTTTKKQEESTTKKQEETTTKSDVMEDEELKWTNAGYANEVKKTASGDYIYVTNIKQTIDKEKGNDFYMTLKDFKVAEWTAMDIGAYIKGNSGRIRWTSEDPSVAQVIDNEIVGIYAGTTKISGTCGNTTVHINVTVEHGYRSNDISLNSQIVTLYPNESYQLIASERGATYTSANPDIAKVSADGVVTGVKAGKTTVTASYNGKQCVCKVTVAENNGSYMNSTLDTKYTITKERVLLATDRTFIVLDAGVVIEDKLLENIEILLDKIEKVTGYSFTNTNNKLSSYSTTDRIVIAVSAYGSAYAHTNGVVIAPYDITLEECGAHVLAHELIHVVQHRNTVYCGSALTEGYAEYFGMDVYNNLSFCRNTYDENYNSWSNFNMAFRDITLTADNIEYYLMHSPDSHPTSYFFVSYLVKTYGEGIIKELQTAITDEFIKRFGTANGGGIKEDFTEEDIFAIIKSKTSANVAKDFLTYFNGLEKQTQAKKLDLSGLTGVFYEKFTGHMTGSYLDLGGGDIYLNGPLVIDFTHAIDYVEKVFGRKAKGINVDNLIIYEDHIEEVPVIYYDAAGNVVEMPEDFDTNYGMMPAVRVKIDKQTPGEIRLFVKTQFMFDEYY